MRIPLSLLFIIAVVSSQCGAQKQSAVSSSLPEPSASHQKNIRVVGWPAGRTPSAPDGFTVTRFAENLQTPRWIYQMEDGSVLIAQSRTGRNSPNNILILRDTNNDGRADTRSVFLSGLYQPLGMLVLNNYFYVANTDGLYRYPLQKGQTSINSTAEKILNLPAGGYNNHWTRNIIASKDGSKIYVSVGSGSNVAEHGISHEARRADILEINPDGSGERVYASGLRNPVGMAWEPVTGKLWTAVNERDELGDELVPDYMTSVQDGGFYGWPYAYFGQHEDPRRKGERPDLVSKTLIPDVDLGSHTASLGLDFYQAKQFPSHYHGGAFVGQHGSWNRSSFSGYKVVFVPFSNGKAGTPEDFLTGFIADESRNEVYGRPVGTTVLKNGSLLVADDGAGIIWSVQRH